ncbi:hypothetical protein AMTRI_Chr07g76870 [Amborella trichopoda]
MGRKKRVRFADVNTGSTSNYKSHDSSTIANRTHALEFEKPKTSEYSFYKRLCRDAEQNLHSYGQQIKCKAQLGSNISKSIAEQNDNIRHKHEVLRPLSLIENVAAFDPISPLLKDVEGPRKSGLQYEQGKIFSETRHRLLKLATETLSLGVDDLVSRRSKLISEFLGRLSIQNKCGTSALSRKMTRTITLGFDSSYSNMSIEELPPSPGPNLEPQSSKMSYHCGMLDLHSGSSEIDIPLLPWDTDDSLQHNSKLHELSCDIERSPYASSALDIEHLCNFRPKDMKMGAHSARKLLDSTETEPFADHNLSFNDKFDKTPSCSLSQLPIITPPLTSHKFLDGQSPQNFHFRNALPTSHIFRHNRSCSFPPRHDFEERGIDPFNMNISRPFSDSLSEKYADNLHQCCEWFCCPLSLPALLVESFDVSDQRKQPKLRHFPFAQGVERCFAFPGFDGVWDKVAGDNLEAHGTSSFHHSEKLFLEGPGTKPISPLLRWDSFPDRTSERKETLWPLLLDAPVYGDSGEGSFSER